jgi:alpha-galactosidase
VTPALSRSSQATKDRQFLDLVARSGSALSVCVYPATRTPDVEEDLSSALRISLDGNMPGGIELLDWLQTMAPEL